MGNIVTEDIVPEDIVPEDIRLEDIGLGNTIALIEQRRFLASHDTRCLGLSAISVNFMSS